MKSTFRINGSFEMKALAEQIADIDGGRDLRPRSGLMMEVAGLTAERYQRLDRILPGEATQN